MSKQLLLTLLPVMTACIGYVGGLFSDSIKAAIKRRQDVAALRRALFVEIAGNIEHMHYSSLAIRANIPETYPPAQKWIRTAAFDDAMKNSVIFYGIKEAREISDFYLALKLAGEKSSKEQPDIFNNLFAWMRDKGLRNDQNFKDVAQLVKERKKT